MKIKNRRGMLKKRSIVSEGKLKQSEGKLKTLVENIPDIVMEVARDGTIQFINRTVQGFSIEKTIGKKLFDFIPPNYHKKVKNAIKYTFKTGKSTNYEIAGAGANNSIHFYETKISPVKLGRKINTVINIARDITEKKKAEDELKESEEKYKTLYESSSDAIMTLFPPSWKFTSGNPSTIILFNTKNEKEFASLEPWQLSPKYQPDGELSTTKAKKMIGIAMKKGSNFFEWTHCTKQGKPFPATVLLTRINWKNKTGLQATVRDISSLKKAEDALKESEEKFRNFFENSNDALFIADGRTRKLVDCNKKAEILMEYPRTKLLTMNADNLHPKDKVKETMEEFKKQMGGKITITETEVLTKSGKRIPVSINASSMELNGENYGIAVFRDITEKKKAEEELRDSENKFSKIFKSSPDMIALTRISDGFFIDANDTIKNILGYKREELLGHTVKELGLWPNPEERELMVQAIKKQGSIKGMGVHLRKKSGEIFPAKISVELLKLNGKKFLLSVAHDITEEKRAQEIIKKEIGRMKEIDETKTNFLNIVSHEMKTPLTAINAHLGVMDDLKGNLNEQELLSLGAIKRNNYLLKSLIDNILELSRIESGKFELNMSKINLERIIKEVKSNLEILSEKKGLQLTLDIGKLPEIIADEMRIREILNNLISNSIKFTDKGWIKVKAESQDNHVVIKVIDRGIGIQKDKIPELFQKFYQIDPSIGRRFGGTGLGLAITKQLIELQGGKITVESTYGKGSTFSVILPINNHIMKGGEGAK